jgi:ribosomal protein uL22
LKYSYNQEKSGIIFAGASDLNVSFKDLGAVCDSVRYLSVPYALKVLEGVINEGRPIEFRRHNKYMGSRHELGGKKGRYPIKCAKLVKTVLVNAAANAVNKGEDPEYMYVVHAAANKGQIVPRMPSKGVRAVRSGGYGYTKLRTSNIEFAKIEIGISDKENKDLGARMQRAVLATSKKEKPLAAPVKTTKKQAKPTAKPVAKPLPVPKAEKEPEKKLPEKPLPPAQQPKPADKTQKKEEGASAQQPSQSGSADQTDTKS